MKICFVKHDAQTQMYRRRGRDGDLWLYREETVRERTETEYTSMTFREGIVVCLFFSVDRNIVFKDYEINGCAMQRVCYVWE